MKGIRRTNGESTPGGEGVHSGQWTVNSGQKGGALMVVVHGMIVRAGREMICNKLCVLLLRQVRA
jgi:hypothetical protein